MALIYNQLVKVKWHYSTRKYYETLGYNFTNTGDEFEVHIKHIPPGGNLIVKAICDWCEKDFERNIGRLNRNNTKNHFCDNKCQHDHRSHISEITKHKNNCEECGKEYKLNTYKLEYSKYCSLKCSAKAKGRLSRGKNSSKYVERIKACCDWCSSDIYRTPNRLENRNYNFCDEKCRQDWHKNVYVKTDEFIENNRQVMLRNLSEGKIKLTETKPHVAINELLDKLGIKYINEFTFDLYSVDIKLTDFELLIEINGGFWHTDNRLYDKIEYTQQLNRIIGDKRKRSFLKNKYKIDLLYLWELDIETNLELCEKIILNYINNSGSLKNYHSFNYHLNTNGDLLLNEEKIKPYMEWSPNKLADITDFSVREKRTGFQPDKHISFKCEYCGTEKTTSVVTYIKAKNHYCSTPCSNKAQQIGCDTDTLGHIVSCHNCNKEFKLVNHRYQNHLKGKTKNLFCSNGCKNDFQKTIKGEDNPQYERIEVNCEHCGKADFIPKNRLNRYRYCSKECRASSKKKRIKYNCEYCLRECETTPYKYNRSKNHFCSHTCADTYRKIIKTVYNKCELCGKWHPVILSKVNQRFCSTECQSVWQSITFIGKNANNYKHGLRVSSD